MTTTSNLTILYKPYNSSTWVDIAGRISTSDKPQGNNQTRNDLFQFDLAFIEPTNDSDYTTKVYPDNGDDIVVCDSQTKQSIMGKSCAGKIVKKEITCNGWTGNYAQGTLIPNLTHKFSVKQHEFSKKPFRLSYEQTTSLNTILDAILLNDTIDILGGSFTEDNGSITVVPKYINFADNVDIAQYVFTGTAREHLTELLKIVAYDWEEKYFCREDITYGLKLIGQIQIWQD